MPLLQACTSHFRSIAFYPAERSVVLTRWTRMLPMFVVQAYLAVSVLVFVIGPWDYPPFNSVLLYGFVGCAHLFLLLGYLSAAFKAPARYRWRFQIQHLTLAAVAVTFLLIFPTSYFRTGHLFPDVLTGLANPGLAYNISYTFRLGSSPGAEYVRIGAGPLIGLCLPLVVVYWNRLSRTLRTLGVATIGLNLGLFVAMGTNKALADA